MMSLIWVIENPELYKDRACSTWDWVSLDLGFNSPLIVSDGLPPDHRPFATLSAILSFGVPGNR